MGKLIATLLFLLLATSPALAFRVPYQMEVVFQQQPEDKASFGIECNNPDLVEAGVICWTNGNRLFFPWHQIKSIFVGEPLPKGKEKGR